MHLLPERFTVLLAVPQDQRLDFLSDQLTADGFDVVTAASTQAATSELERMYPDAVIVGTRMPDRPGLDLVELIRDESCTPIEPGTPVIALTEQADPLERVRALERGADDVLGGALHYPELLARLRSLLLRRHRGRRPGPTRVGLLTVDPASRQVLVGSTPVTLSSKEYALLSLLATEPTRVYSKDEILRAIWGFRATNRTRTLDSHACRLRQKLAVGGGKYVVNVWGVGYRLCDLPSSGAPDTANEPSLIAA